MDYLVVKIIYVVIFLAFIPVFFKILRAIEIEKYFKKGMTIEIRLAYILFSIILSQLLTSGIERIFSLILSV